MKFKYNFKVYAPATIANFAVNKHNFSIALQDLQDEIIVKKSTIAGVSISQIINNKTKISKAIKENTAAYTAQLIFQHLIETKQLDTSLGIELELRKKIPLSYGLGSSIASACGAALATNIAFGNQLDRKELIPFIHKALVEINKKNRISSIISCLDGGLVLQSSKLSFEFYRFPLPRGLQFCLGIPKIKEPAFRSKLAIQDKNYITLESSDAATFTQALYTNNLKLIQQSLKNYYCYPQNNILIALRNKIYNKEALYFDFVNRHTAMFAFCKNTVDAENIAIDFESFYKNYQIKNKVLTSSINQEGCTAT